MPEKINVANQKGSILAPLKVLNYLLKKTDTLTFASEVQDASTTPPIPLLSWLTSRNQEMLFGKLDWPLPHSVDTNRKAAQPQPSSLSLWERVRVRVRPSSNVYAENANVENKKSEKGKQ